jgi:RNA polymerase sigma-70 factor (TIGR02957 family)
MTDIEDLYRDLRPYAFAIAYRMLGSVSEAEDVVQDAFVRLSGADVSAIENPKGYLATVTTRLAIDALRSARTRRESYFGPWLPEPLVVDESADVADAAETADSLAMAFLVVLEKLSPVERAVFLLRDVFDHDYDEIARIVGKSEANCRQLARCARVRIEQGRPRFEASRRQRAALADRFLAACRDGDMDGLVSLLAGDVAFYGDGGGQATAIEHPMFGRDKVARFLLGLFRRGGQLGVQMVRVEVNGQPGAEFLDPDGKLISVVSLDIADCVVQSIRVVVNPDKLGHLGVLSPLARRSNADG